MQVKLIVTYNYGESNDGKNFFLTKVQKLNDTEN